MKNEPIIIIGMHRSGTSMLTRFIEESGVFMGNPKNMGQNEEAFFFQELNEWMLYQKGISWDNTSNESLKSEFTDSNITRVISNRLNSIHTYKFLGLKKFLKSKNLKNVDFSWGWKDPKNTLTLDIWKRIFPNAKIIHIHRNPIDVANSLFIREQKIENSFRNSLKLKRKEFLLLKRPCYNQSVRVTFIEEGIKLWEEYVQLAHNAKSQFKNFHSISYEEFLDKPEETLEDLAEFLKIETDLELINSISSQIKPDRKYAFLNDNELINLYQKVKNKEIIKILNYSDIV
jgi:hypothetical protein